MQGTADKIDAVGCYQSTAPAKAHTASFHTETDINYTDCSVYAHNSQDRLDGRREAGPPTLVDLSQCEEKHGEWCKEGTILNYTRRCVTCEFAAPAAVSVAVGTVRAFGGKPADSVKDTPGVSLAHNKEEGEGE